MKPLYKIILFVMATQTIACKRSLEKEAKSAAKDFCNCIQKNIFIYKNADELYGHCHRDLEKKYRFISIYFKMTGDDNYLEALSVSTIDSVSTFKIYFYDSQIVTPHYLPYRNIDIESNMFLVALIYLSIPINSSNKYLES